MDRLVDQLDETINTEGVYLIFQMFMGGGMHRDNPRRNHTALPHRDISFGYVYDIFYKNEQTALELQAKMTELLRTTLDPERDSVRFLWGSFNNTDMRNASVQRFYYQDPSGTPYPRLADIKRRFDPTDLFHTSFTVQLPSGPPGGGRSAASAASAASANESGPGTGDAPAAPSGAPAAATARDSADL